MALNNAQKAAIQNMVLKELVAICQLEGVNYFDLPKNVQTSIVAAFQFGVGFFAEPKNYKAALDA